MIYYIYSPSEEAFVETCKVHLKKEEVTYLSIDALDTFDVSKASHLLVTGCLDEIKLLLTIAHQAEVTVGIIPTDKQKELMRTFALPSKLEDAITLALTPTEKNLTYYTPMEVWYCKKWW